MGIDHNYQRKEQIAAGQQNCRQKKGVESQQASKGSGNGLPSFFAVPERERVSQHRSRQHQGKGPAAHIHRLAGHMYGKEGLPDFQSQYHAAHPGPAVLKHIKGSRVFILTYLSYIHMADPSGQPQGKQQAAGQIA